MQHKCDIYILTDYGTFQKILENIIATPSFL